MHFEIHHDPLSGETTFRVVIMPDAGVPAPPQAQFTFSSLRARPPDLRNGDDPAVIQVLSLILANTNFDDDLANATILWIIEHAWELERGTSEREQAQIVSELISLRKTRTKLRERLRDDQGFTARLMAWMTDYGYDHEPLYDRLGARAARQTARDPSREPAAQPDYHQAIRTANGRIRWRTTPAIRQRGAP